jgi:hypothetical protein
MFLMHEYVRRQKFNIFPGQAQLLFMNEMGRDDHTGTPDGRPAPCRAGLAGLLV